MGRIDPAALFIYVLTVTFYGFIARETADLAMLAIVNGIPGLILGARRSRVIFALIVLGIIGMFFNAILVSNTGEQVASIGPLIIREGAIRAAVNVSLRFIAIGGAALLFSSLINPREALRAFEEKLGLPRGLAFAAALAFRLFLLAQKDLEEVLAVRKQRGARTIPITPTDIKSIVSPIFNVMLERGVWIGVAAELRGLRLAASRRRLSPPFDKRSIALYLAAIIQGVFLLIT